MTIFKENSYDIVRLYINQIGIMIFSLFLYSAIAEIEDEALFGTLRILVSVLSILFYFVLVYNIVWEIGAKDKIKAESGKYTYNSFKGAIISAFANVPNFVLALLSAIFFLCYKLFEGKWMVDTAGVLFAITKLHGSMFMGLIQGITSSPAATDPSAVVTDSLIESALFFVLPLASIAFTQLSYWLGTKEFRIFGTSKKPE